MQLTLDALVVEDLDVQVLAGTPFMITNDISLHPAKWEVLVQGSEVLVYNSEAIANSHTQSFVLRSSSPATVIFPGDFL